MSETVTINVENISEENLPEIIKTEVESLSEYKKKKQKAKEKAEEAKKIADEMKGVKVFKTKAAVEDLQAAAKAFGEAQVLAAEAQEKSFEYQEKLAAAAKYLFALGVTNMSMNRSVVRELRATLEGANPESLDELAQQELENVISQLLAQEDIMFKQEKMADTIDIIDDEVAEHRVQIKSNTERILKTEEETIHQAELIKAGIDKDKEQDRLLAEKAEIDAVQDKEIKEQRQKDTEHDAKLEKLQIEINLLAEKVKNVIPLKQYRIHMAIVGAFSIIAMILAIVGMTM